MKIISVGSYAEAEKKGIKPVDSIISGGTPVYFKKKKNPPYEVVGFAKGWGFNENDVTFPINLKDFLAVTDISDNEIEVTATNSKIAKKIVKDMLKPNVKFDLYRRKLEKVV